MGRRKAAENCKIKPWLSANSPPSDGRFIQVGNSLFLSKKFHSLNYSSQILYLDLAIESGGKNTVKLSRNQATKKYGIKPATYSRGIKELIQAGFIRISPDCGKRETNCFEFINEWKLINHVSN